MESFLKFKSDFNICFNLCNLIHELALHPSGKTLVYSVSCKHKVWGLNPPRPKLLFLLVFLHLLHSALIYYVSHTPCLHCLACGLVASVLACNHQVKGSNPIGHTFLIFYHYFLWISSHLNAFISICKIN